jgi:hypothetical protein
MPMDSFGEATREAAMAAFAKSRRQKTKKKRRTYEPHQVPVLVV